MAQYDKSEFEDWCLQFSTEADSTINKFEAKQALKVFFDENVNPYEDKWILQLTSAGDDITFIEKATSYEDIAEKAVERYGDAYIVAAYSPKLEVYDINDYVRTNVNEWKPKPHQSAATRLSMKERIMQMPLEEGEVACKVALYLNDGTDDDDDVDFYEVVHAVSFAEVIRLFSHRYASELSFTIKARDWLGNRHHYDFKITQLSTN
ncbi:hypothetical protein SAMN05444141_11313 [Pseudovibrio denitrificans]|uniref:Uncharacterized protein n=1 Tax=Pseudovibrio denitrificans TaxID=258256 RepID=A0A1I7DYH2_9HYPH|nr:hypothetical protein [Pseudovibrio denitrificans]SFU16739.1 hypothetical protein SAMN05444141_11313 [Pseudovibrio denitrificans]